MSSLGTEILGVIFLLLGTAATFLMFYQWGFPYDAANHRSQAPPWLNRSLRILGYIHLFIYLYMMWAMIPRLWTYQVELPARTVAHLVLGIAIGAILVIKISVVRWFKFLEKLRPHSRGRPLYLHCRAGRLGPALLCPRGLPAPGGF